MKKRLPSILIALTLIISMIGLLPTNVSAIDDDTQYICLLLDTSGEKVFNYTGLYDDDIYSFPYTKPISLDSLKTITADFINSVLPNKNIKISIISYNETATVISDFSNDITALTSAINSLSVGPNNSSNIYDGLQKAEELLKHTSGQKDIILVTTGMTNLGTPSSYGKYDNTHETMGDIKSNKSGYKIYEHANGTINIADRIKKSATIHTICMYNNNNPTQFYVTNAKDISDFCLDCAEDIASDSKFNAINDIDSLTKVFKELSANFPQQDQITEEVYEFDAWNKNSGSRSDYGYSTRNHEQWTGDEFYFYARTSQDVEEISLVADKPFEKYGHEIPYSYLDENYFLDYEDDDYSGERIWTCYFGIHEHGPRTFWLKVNGHLTDYSTNLQVYENKYDAGAISVTVNGKLINFDVPPQLINGRTMIPIRAVAEALGGRVWWQENNNTAGVTALNIKEDIKRTCYIRIGESFMNWENDGAWINGGLGGTIKLDSPAVLIDGRTLVPIRAIAECFGYDVEWDENTQTVIITN